MQANLFFGEPPEEMLEAAKHVYAAAFGQPPYREGPEQAGAFVARARRYATERDSVRLALVTDDGPAAMALAVLARPGDWWRDRAAEAVGPEKTERWIGELCLEVVHLAVHPEQQGRGLGRLVHDLVRAGKPARTALLSCNPAATPANGLYAGRGWTSINPHGLMARDL